MNRRRWDQVYSGKSPKVSDIVAADRKRIIADTVEQIIAYRRPQTVVDIGCGAGTFIQRFSSRFRSIVGVDYAKAVVNQAQRRCRRCTNVTWVVQDVTTARSVISPCDLAVCLNVVTSPSSRHRAALWRALCRLTRAGGTAIVVVPSLESHHCVMRIATYFGLRADPLDNNGCVVRGGDPQKFFAASEVLAALARVGFTPALLAAVPYAWSHEGLPHLRSGVADRPWDWLVVASK
jgi:SAM-dependent methyltransferase